MNKKTIALVFALILVFGAAVGGTLAWLTDSTTEVKNTFTVGNIDIELEETTDDFKMVPGAEIDKDPIVTVKAKSEACWVFVKVTESDNLDDFITYTIAEGWTELTEGSGIYYRAVAASETDQEFSVLAGDKVSVLETVTKDMMDALCEKDADGNLVPVEERLPTLTFKAAAAQQANAEGGTFTAPEAYALVKDKL